ncbi:phage tail tube assembly chaperone [Lactobacillus sp. B4005]|uniref:phage tail tube assembly chaperone n=1 Tax=Lactobacillus sp. B4005 TaxID=2818031 RepID=UPI002269FC6D|nr:phage tail tube assembly chaperone [Lactobacillus sp. B4005]MCX8723053.1 hypothetical protein [Lactobacillus sp. B4005]
MSVKVNGKKLHLTTFEVSTTGANIRKCLVAQRDFAKVNQTISNVDLENDESIINSLDAQIQLIDTYTDFLKPILKLSNDQVKKVEESDFSDVVDFANEVIEKVLGFDSDKSKESESK